MTATISIDRPPRPNPTCFHILPRCENITDPKEMENLCHGCKCGLCEGNEEDIKRCGGNMVMHDEPQIVIYITQYSTSTSNIGKKTKRLRLRYTCETCGNVSDSIINADHSCDGLTEQVRFKLSLLDHPMLMPA